MPQIFQSRGVARAKTSTQSQCCGIWRSIVDHRLARFAAPAAAAIVAALPDLVKRWPCRRMRRAVGDDPVPRCARAGAAGRTSAGSSVRPEPESAKGKEIDQKEIGDD